MEPHWKLTSLTAIFCAKKVNNDDVRDLRPREGLDAEGIAESVVFNEGNSNVSQIEELLLLHHDVLGQNVGDLYNEGKNTSSRSAAKISFAQYSWQ